MIIKDIIFNPNVVSGKVGNVVTFGYSIVPSDATDRRVEIKSLHPNIVGVSGNSFRFFKEGFATIAVKSLDGGVYKEFVIASAEKEDGDLSYIIRDAESQLAQFKLGLNNELKLETEGFKKEISNVSEGLKQEIINVKSSSISEILSETQSSKDKISDKVSEGINEIVTAMNNSLIELATAVNIGENEIEEKIQEANTLVDLKMKAISDFVESERQELLVYTEQTLSAATEEITSLIESKKHEANGIASGIIENLEKYENFALSNIDIKFNESLNYIESAESTAINNILIAKDQMISNLQTEIDGVSVTIQTEVHNAIVIIEQAETDALAEISKLETTLKFTINGELEKAIETINEKLALVLNEMNEHNFGLMNQLTAKKDELIAEIAVDKDNMLIELEKEKNRLIELIQAERANLFNDLEDMEQEIINNIQLTVQGYDLELEIIKDAKIQSIQTATNGYSTMIEDAKNTAQQAVTDLANAFMTNMTEAKDYHITEMQNKKNQFTTELTNEKGTHSSNLTKEYNTHKDALDAQVNHSTTGLKKQLQNDYTTHSTALTSEKNTHSTSITNLKNSSVTEITNVKNSALDELGRTSSTGQWGTIRNSIISTGIAETNKVTAEGSRIQDLLLGIESNVVQIGEDAIAAIGTSNSTGKRGEAITAIESNKNSAVQRIGTSDTAMDGSNPSVRKSAYDGIVSIKNSATTELTNTKTTLVSQATTEINNVKNSAVNTVNQTKDSAIVEMNNKKDEFLGEINIDLSIPSTPNKGVKRDANGDVFARYYNGVLKGNADTASKLSAAKTFTFSGDVSGSVSFDGSANVTASLQVEDDSHNHVIANVDNLQTELNTLKNNADSRVSKSGDTMTGALKFNTSSSTALSITGNGGTVEIGSSSIEGEALFGYCPTGGASYSNHLRLGINKLQYQTNYTTYNIYHQGFKPNKTDVGLNLVDNTADSAKNVLSATKLTTARTIGGVSFDGTANINLPGVNASGNQNTTGSSASCTGNSATATKLQTARSINGTNFDGTGAITTANWGTARTITIGNTGKLVNGSENVAWSATELGLDVKLDKGNYTGTAETLKSEIDTKLNKNDLPTLPSDIMRTGDYDGTGEDLKNEIDVLEEKISGSAEDLVTQDNAIWGGLYGGYIQDNSQKVVGQRYIDQIDGKAYICKVPSQINSIENYTPCNVVDNTDKLDNIILNGLKLVIDVVV